MSHWADQYVGLPAEGERPCWALVRRVWIEQLGFFMPSYQAGIRVKDAIEEGSQLFRQVKEEEEYDAVLCRSFGISEAHIGVVVKKGLVLHNHINETSRIDQIKTMQVTRIMRGPWNAC